MNEEKRKITVAVLEDSRWDRDAIVRDLAGESDIQVLEPTADPGRFYLQVLDARPDVAIIDLKIMNDERAGLKVLGDLQAARLTTHYFVLTTYAKLTHFITALDRGADAFMSKEVLEEQKPSLAATVRMLVAGGTYYDGRLVKELRRHITVPTDRLLELDAADRKPSLSPAEREVLRAVADGLTYVEIARMRDTTDNTIKSQLNSIRDKFGVRKTGEAVELARFLGMLGE